MMKISIIYILLCITLITISCDSKSRTNGINIDWVNNLEGDYSFTNKWEYPEGIYKNDFGQLVCDGLCDPATDSMRDEEGKIYQDSIYRYYVLTDTTHINYNIECDANCYEWAGTNGIVIEVNKSMIEGYTLCNAATHSSLQFTIEKNVCTPQIVLNSITSVGEKYYQCNGGYIKIDKKQWKQGIMKAEFHFTFSDPDNTKEKMWWKGKIYTNI